MKHAFRLPRPAAAAFALAVLFAASAAGARAQTLSPTPDTAIFQITNSTIPAPPPATPTPTPSPTPSPTATPFPTPAPLSRDSFVGDVSGDGRFVVMESTGDISTERTATRNNADGNPEIFLFDYVQRRIFQITNTKNSLKDTTLSPIADNNIDVQVVNLRPVISHDGKFIVFVSNAYSDADPTLSPLNFDGQANAAALHADGNTELFIYRIPDVPAADLSSGAEVAPVNLSAGTMTRVTFTPASAVPRAGGTSLQPFFALDNNAPAVNDDASFIAFVSQSASGIPGESNADGNQEIFIYNRLTGAFVQVTNTKDVPSSSANPLGTLVFNVNPSLSGSGSVLAFLSNADINTTETSANQGNGEVYLANFNGTAVSNLQPVTKTPPPTAVGTEGTSVNLLSPGRHLSRDGAHLVFESVANFNADGTLNGALLGATGVYVYNIPSGSSLAGGTFTQFGSRPPSGATDVGLHFPVFTGDSTRVLWSSNLNFNTDGTVSTSTTSGINQPGTAQVFSAPLSAPTQISRVSALATGAFNSVQPFPSDTIRRYALSVAAEQGGGNSDFSNEAFYNLIPSVTSETPAPSPTPAASPAPVTFATGASDIPVASASPSPTPFTVTGLSPGELGIMNSTLTLAPSTQQVSTGNAHEVLRRPPLPVELNGVSVAISGAAAGLYFVSANQINFVVPPGLASSSTVQPVVVFNNGSLVRTSLLLNPVEPDIFTSTNGPGGRAAVLNVTNPCVAPTGEPFSVTTTRPTGSGLTGNCTAATTETAPTHLLIMVTGLRPPSGSTASVTVTIGTTTLSGTSIIGFRPSLTPGFDQLEVELPASLAGAGDVPVVINATVGSATFTSRPASSAPHITIQ
ncbi:MAG TPA: hypothetical protein VFA21_01480 [Pyrinomonadaceae bacterium]|nr:hypothetical protein [Pyrinomonadaceae bacterium]